MSSSSGYKRSREDEYSAYRGGDSGSDRRRRQVSYRDSAEDAGGLPYDEPSVKDDRSNGESKKQRSWRDEYLQDDRDNSRRRSTERRRDDRKRDDRGDYRKSSRDHRLNDKYHDRRGNSSSKPVQATSPRRSDQKEEGGVSPPRSSNSAVATTINTSPSATEAVTSASNLVLEPAAAAPMEEEPVEDPTPQDLEAQLEERRRKRREILERFAGIESGAGSVASSAGGSVTGVTSGLGSSTAKLNLESTTPSLQTTPLPVNSEFDVAKHSDRLSGQTDSGDVLPVETRAKEVDGEEQISAADYNPDEDRKVDDERKQALFKDKEVVDVDKKEEESEWEEIEVDAEEDDDFDMFALEEAPKKKVIRRKKQKHDKPVTSAVSATINSMDNYDDAEGYYRITPGEILNAGRYKVTINLGKGMFAQVIRATVLLDNDEDGEKKGSEVAIKVIRSQESMYVAGKKEAQILRKLGAADPEDKKHVVRMTRTFEHRGHLCLVFENLSMNLRDVVKRFGKDVGLNLRAVRAYAHQMFLALSLMKKCNIIHGDLKPDNILVTENKAMLKVCDLGSACDISEADITPYLVSRFYRAPEIILGLKYDETIDMWSIGCTLYELYTGKILFPGRSNNQMLHLMMDLKGKINHRMIKKAQFGEMHFDESMNFISVEKDKITGQDVIKTLVINKAARELKARLIPSSNVLVKMKEDEAKLLTNFVDLLDKALTLDPTKRLSARDALLHPFLMSQ